MTADPVATQLARAQCDRELAALTEGGSFVGKVRTLVSRGDDSTRSLDEVARRLHVSTRTLKRRLAEQGTSFSAVLEGVRHQRARCCWRTVRWGWPRWPGTSGTPTSRTSPAPSGDGRARPPRPTARANAALASSPDAPFPVKLRDMPPAAARWLPRVAAALFVAAASLLAWREGGGADPPHPPPEPGSGAGPTDVTAAAGHGAPAFEVKRRRLMRSRRHPRHAFPRRLAAVHPAILAQDADPLDPPRSLRLRSRCARVSHESGDRNAVPVACRAATSGCLRRASGT